MRILPHVTRNTALAVTAFLLRVPITRKRVYTAEFLKERKLDGRTAFKNGILGDVYYAIHTEESDEAKQIVNAFNDEKLAIEEGRETAEFDVDPDVVARIACRVLFARKSFFRDLLKLVPCVRIPHKGSVQKSGTGKDGSYTINVPGFKNISIDASDEVKQHLS